MIRPSAEPTQSPTPPSPLETLPDTVADYTLNDAVWMVPREASRIHATILRRRTEDVTEYWARDESSSTGTYVNGRRLGLEDEDECASAKPTRLTNGDVISLGPSGINSYVFVALT